MGKFFFESIVDCSSDASALLFRVYQDAGHEFSWMIHVRYIDQFPEADNPVPFKIDTFEPFQEILCPVHALVTATTFRYTNAIVRIIRIIDLNQPFVTAGTKLSEPKGEVLCSLILQLSSWEVCQASRFLLTSDQFGPERNLVKVHLASGGHV